MRRLLLLLCMFLGHQSGVRAEMEIRAPRRIFVTACNERYFQSCLTLIASLHRTSFEDVDEILVYNLGLSLRSIEILNALKKVRTKFFEECRDKFPSIELSFFYHQPGSFGWKQVAIHDASDQEGDLIFWLDAGALLLQSVREIYDWIAREEIFLVRDEGHHNFTWTHQQCIQTMQATPRELRDFQLCGGIQGYRRGGKYQALMDEALKYSLIRECVDGHKFYDYGESVDHQRIKGHRHDQSILSILASRYSAPTQKIERYGEWRSLDHCQVNDSVIWVHRGSYHNVEGLLFSRKSQPTTAASVQKSHKA